MKIASILNIICILLCLTMSIRGIFMASVIRSVCWAMGVLYFCFKLYLSETDRV